ncbi:hypothetical protein CHS0354_037057 [Potamilus streckersoni]|uniref:Uncharacterized protein n=1 Tax=Potamilus streckersoni TaxID=2493646 RepID=A0AAE0SL30_9BIVA|nr:hypothetical protein CHS0354_037057 [Potamilus streckersoni]
MKEPLSRLDSRTALHIAVYKNEIEQVIDCIKKKDVNLNVTDFKGRTPLFYSACYCRREIMAILLKAGSDPNVADNKGNTPLHEAVEKSDLDIVHSLVQHGKININLKNNDGQTALMKASYFDYIEILSTLIKEDADPDVQDNNGRTALHIALNEGSILSADLLMRYGCNVNLFTACGHSSLYITVHSPHNRSLDMAKLLITSGYDARPDSGWLSAEKHSLFIQDQTFYVALQTHLGEAIMPKEPNISQITGIGIARKPSFSSQSPLVRKLSIKGDDGEIPIRRHYLSPASPRIIKRLCSQTSREEFNLPSPKLPLSPLSVDGVRFFPTSGTESSSRSPPFSGIEQIFKASLDDSESKYPLILPKVPKRAETLSLSSKSLSSKSSPPSSPYISHILDIPKEDDYAFQENDSHDSETDAFMTSLPASSNVQRNGTAEATKGEDQLTYSKNMDQKWHSPGITSIFKRSKSVLEQNSTNSCLLRRKVSFEISS